MALLKSFPHYHQLDAMDCGPTCIRIIAKHYGKILRLDTIRKLSSTTRTGTSLFSLAEAAESIGLKSLAVKCSFKKLVTDAELPCIVHWNNEHFIVLYKHGNDKVYVSDPAQSTLVYSKQEFINGWIGKNATETEDEGVALLLEPSTRFELLENEGEDKFFSSGILFLRDYFLKFKTYIAQLLIAFVASSILALIFPFLTQSIVDTGIQNQDIGFIYTVLIAQVFLTLAQIIIDILKGWVLLHLSTRINVSLISDFFIKLMNLPISFFDKKLTGDILIRIQDHNRIENFLTTSTLSVLFSVLNAVVFSAILAVYNLTIFNIFLACTIFQVLWSFIFLKQRAKLDYQKFTLSAKENSKVIELINGMQDIKLNNAELTKRWSWEHIQAALFKLKVKSLRLEQLQDVGANLINQVKQIGILVYAAQLVVSGNLTLGMMLAVTFIVSQANAPIIQLLVFLRSGQDAKLSLERLNEIHAKQNEEDDSADKLNTFSKDDDIFINDLTFRYPGSDSHIINNFNAVIPANKTTAIVGASGGGKTTLLKLLLKFYEPDAGEIRVGKNPLKYISQKAWREQVGVVLQEGFIFNDSIANNICLGADTIDIQKLIKSAQTANIMEFISELPLGFNTKIGQEGIGISTGQKQRILIARAIYKDPKIIFFDEPTSALDANNERIIMRNLNNIFKNRTVVIIAHRLSTVQNADQIIVIENGRIAEVGNHEVLTKNRGPYFNLVKNQLALETLQN
ncbi:MAG TPA: peptidase domain-containing ABC transporter [Ohtaekwangia sp.]|uniref:peptidase domain-containing ABC transporter n=1 Tax=Ohtaekwangia sp. TaxID=2066019 RepID=UPI002F92A749